MTDGSLPEGLVERCAVVADQAWDEAAKRRETESEISRSIAKAVLAVAAPAIREQALRDAGQMPTLTLPTLPRSKIRDLEAENSRLNAELMRERAWRNKS